jgi:site-specific recombinase XerD
LPKLWKDCLEKAGFNHIAIKDATRNSIASQTVNRGVSMEAVSKTLGHSSIQITADRYAKMEVDSLRSVVDAENIVELPDRATGAE